MSGTSRLPDFRERSSDQRERLGEFPPRRDRVDLVRLKFAKQAVLSPQRLVKILQSLQDFARRRLFAEAALEAYRVARPGVVQNQNVPDDRMTLKRLQLLARLDKAAPRVLPLLECCHLGNKITPSVIQCPVA